MGVRICIIEKILPTQWVKFCGRVKVAHDSLDQAADKAQTLGGASCGVLSSIGSLTRMRSERGNLIVTGLQNDAVGSPAERRSDIDIVQVT